MKPKEIGKQLLEDYVRGKYAIIDQYPERFEFCIDGLTIRCRGHLEPVTAVANKFGKGNRYGGGTGPLKTGSRPSIKRAKFAERVFNRFMEEGERDNAVNYALLYPIDELNMSTLRVLNKVKRERNATSTDD